MDDHLSILTLKFLFFFFAIKNGRHWLFKNIIFYLKKNQLLNRQNKPPEIATAMIKYTLKTSYDLF